MKKKTSKASSVNKKTVWYLIGLQGFRDGDCYEYGDDHFYLPDFEVEELLAKHQPRGGVGASDSTEKAEQLVNLLENRVGGFKLIQGIETGIDAAATDISIYAESYGPKEIFEYGKSRYAEMSYYYKFGDANGYLDNIKKVLETEEDQTFWFDYGYNMGENQWKCGSHPIRAKNYAEALVKLNAHPIYTSQTAINNKNYDRFGDENPFSVRDFSPSQARMFYLSADCNSVVLETLNDGQGNLSMIIKP